MNPPTPVPILDLSLTSPTPSYLSTLLSTRKTPLLLRGLPLGPCLTLWTSPTHLSSSSPPSKIVSAHVSTIPSLDFISKNFSYKNLPFADLVKHCSTPVLTSDPNPTYWYLRSLGDDPRGRDPSDLATHFPSLSSEFDLPPGLFPEDAYFSSVLRISSPGLRLWTHYDICSNVLAQVVGRKKVILWPPSDAPNLYLVGDKSAVIDLDDPDLLEKYPRMRKCKGTVEAILEPGDVLFIPPMWFHNVTALDYAVGVNVFWKELPSEVEGTMIYDKKDPYGNKDLVPAQLAFRTVDKGTALLKKTLPPEYEDFYLRRIMINIQKRLDQLAPILEIQAKEPLPSLPLESLPLEEAHAVVEGKGS